MTLKLNGSTSGSVSIDAPADTSPTGTDVTLTLPTSAGSSGQYLQTNGSGTLSWQTVSVTPDAITEGNTSVECVDTGSDGHITFDTEGTERMRVEPDGQLLINSTTSRSNVATLEPRIQIEGVNNDTSTVAIISNNTADGTAAQVHLCKSGASGVGSNGAVVNNEVLGRVSFDGSDGTNFIAGAQILSTCEANAATNDMTANLRFYVNNGGSDPSERMKITSTGRLQALTSADNGHLFSTTRTNSSTEELVTYTYNSSDVGGGSLCCVIRTNGNLNNLNNSYGSLSDIKLKENIVDASSQWDDIKGLRPRNYNFKSETTYDTHTQLGLIAQEVELVSPGLVTSIPDRDAEGNDLGTVTKTVNYSVLYMKSVKALQEAMERIETLETANASLEARLTALEGGAS